MPTFSGSFSGKIHAQTIISVPDKPDHSLSLAEVSGTQETTDPKWNNSTINYWVSTDAVGAKGIQRGYFVNDHGSAGRDRGSFEGSVSVVAGQPVVEGKWQYTGGEGSFAGHHRWWDIQDEAHLGHNSRSHLGGCLRACWCPGQGRLTQSNRCFVVRGRCATLRPSPRHRIGRTEFTLCGD